MKPFTKVCLAGFIALIFGSLGLASNEMFAVSSTGSGTATVNLTVIAGNVTIGIDNPFITISGAVNASFSDQVVEKTFSGSFWLQDLKGSASGYYTTVQVSDLINLSDGNYKIGSGNVKFKAGTSTPTAVSGINNPQVKATTTDYETLSSARTYIYRNDSTLPGIVGKYADAPSVQVTVPANTPAGNYQGTLTYTLFEPGISA